MIADPLAGDEDKFELATFYSQKVGRSWSPSLHFFKAVFIVLSAAIQQRLYDEHLLYPRKTEL